MPRYNTSLATGQITGSATISSPFQGAFTQLTGTAPYTVTLPTPGLFPGSNQTFYNSTSGTITLSTPSGNFVGTGGTGTASLTIFAGNVSSVTSDGTNYIVISEDGSPLIATTGLFSSDVTMNGASANISLTPGGTVTVNPSVTGAFNNINIGASTRGSGAFTSLAANGQATFTANIASSSSTTGSLTITGGLGVSGNINSGGTISAVSLSGPLTGTIQTAAQPNITSVGNLTTTGLTVNNFSVIANTSSVNPDSNANKVVAGGISFGAWGVSSGVGGNAGGTGKSWGLGHNGTNFYIGMSNGSADNTQQTYIQMLPNRNLVLVETSGNVGVGITGPQAKLDVVETAASGSWARITHRETASNSAFIGTYRSGSTYSTGIFAHNYALSAWQDLFINSHNDGSGGLGGGLSQRVIIGGKVGVNTISPAVGLHISQNTPTGIGAIPSNTNVIVDNNTHNILLFRNTADNGTNAGIAMQDNNVGGYVLFHNYNASNSTVSDRMHIAGYQGVNIQYGTADSTDVTARTIVAKFDSNGITLNSGDFRDNKNYTKLASYDWTWHARRWATGYVSDVRTNINGRFWNETAAPTNEVFLHTQDLSSTSYIGENIWGDVHNYKAWAVTCIYVKRAFTISATLNGDDPYALYINKQYVTGSDGCCTGVAYNYAFTPGWYRLEMVYSEAGGGHYVQLGWNIRDYLGNISAMTPFGPFG